MLASALFVGAIFIVVGGGTLLLGLLCLLIQASATIIAVAITLLMTIVSWFLRPAASFRDARAVFIQKGHDHA